MPILKGPRDIRGARSAKKCFRKKKNVLPAVPKCVSRLLARAACVEEFDAQRAPGANSPCPVLKNGCKIRSETFAGPGRRKYCEKKKCVLPAEPKCVSGSTGSAECFEASDAQRARGENTPCPMLKNGCEIRRRCCDTQGRKYAKNPIPSKTIETEKLQRPSYLRL